MNQRALVEAIYLRDKSMSGLVGRKWAIEQMKKLASEDVWTDSQIGAILGYAPSSVRKHVAKSEVRRGRKSPQGGTLHPSALDIMLHLTGTLTKEQQGNLVVAAIKTGTSTKLISRLCGIPLGSVLYQQRKMKKELNDGFEPQPQLHDEMPGL